MRRRQHAAIEPITVTIPSGVVTAVPGTTTLISHDGDAPASFRLADVGEGIFVIDISRHSNVRWFITAEGIR
jgi:hypothetical protein